MFKAHVAPHVGAWIETEAWRRQLPDGPESRPTWARGLKPQQRHHGAHDTLSRPTWARGLKLVVISRKAGGGIVAPHVGAWIETTMQENQARGLTKVAPHVGAWIETDRG